MICHRVFECLSEVQSNDILSSDAWPFKERGKEGPSRKVRSIKWKPALEFTLRNESDDVLLVESMDPPTKDAEEEEDDDLIAML